MEPELVNSIKGIQRGLAHLLVVIDPQNEDEWNAFERINAAHKQLRGMEYSKLGQLSLIPKEKEVECPECKGTKIVKDGTGADAMCPKCRGQGVIPESALQAAMPLNESAESKTAFDELESASKVPEWAKTMICAKCQNAVSSACVCAFEETGRSIILTTGTAM